MTQSCNEDATGCCTFDAKRVPRNAFTRGARAVQSAARMPTVHVHRERVRFGDLDANRHLNNVVYLRYFESARIAFMRTLWPDHDPTKAGGDQLGMIFAECHIN